MSGNLEADWGFTGHYYHAPSTLHLAWFRAYDANLGRWISRDSIAEGGGLNVYAYANHDPVNYVDPDGRAPHTAVARGGYLLGAMLGDYLYDKYLNPYLDDYLAENVDPEVAENLKRLLDLADKARALKNPAKLGATVCDATKNRVKPRKATKAKIDEAQPRDADGGMVDPHSGKKLKPDEIDLGHKPGNEWRKRKEMHEERGLTRKEVIEAENDPKLYWWEDRSSNRSHRHEQD